jgi:hypothetical protein
MSKGERFGLVGRFCLSFVLMGFVTELSKGEFVSFFVSIIQFQNTEATIHNEDLCVVDVPAKFQLNRTTNAHPSELLIKT